MHRDAKPGPRCTDLLRRTRGRAAGVFRLRRPARAHSGACSLRRVLTPARRPAPLPAPARPPPPGDVGSWTSSGLRLRRFWFCRFETPSALWVGSRLSPRSGPRRAVFFVRIVDIAPSWHRGASSRPGGACGSDAPGSDCSSESTIVESPGKWDAGVIWSVRKETHAQVETLSLLFSPMRFLLEETIGALCALT
jgi:hypothetical protein